MTTGLLGSRRLALMYMSERPECPDGVSGAGEYEVGGVAEQLFGCCDGIDFVGVHL